MGRPTIGLVEHQARIDKVNPNVEALEYISNRTPSRCKCRICGHIWAEPPKNLHPCLLNIKASTMMGPAFINLRTHIKTSVNAISLNENMRINMVIIF